MSVPLADSPYGALDYFNGELRNDVKTGIDDPTKYRGGSRGRSLVAFSGDHLRPDGIRDELVLHQYKRDERFLTQGGMVGETTTHLRRPGTQEAGSLVQTVRFDGVTYHVPIIAEAGIVGQAGQAQTRATDMWSPNGLHVTQQQDDGNFCSYELARPFDKGRFRALWSAWGGKVANPTWQGV